MKIQNTYKLSLILCVMLISSAWTLVKTSGKAEAQSVTTIPFAGQIATIKLCCNGLEFTTTGQYQSVAYGTFIMEWQKMIPNPGLGFGLYSWWSLIPGEKVLGSVTPGGKCLTIASECEVTTPVTWSVNQVGTTLLSAV